MALHPSITANLQASFQHEDDSTLWQDTGQSTASTTGDPVGSWDDQTNSNDLQQGTTALKPTHTADGIDFDGTEELTTSLTLGTSDFTLYVVLDIPAYVADKMFFTLNDTSIDAFVVYMDDSNYKLWDGSGNDSGDAVVTGKQILVLKRDATNVTLYKDGTNILQVSTTAHDINELQLATWTLNNKRSEITIQAVYLYDDDHSDGDRGTIESDLESAYISSVQNLNPDATSLTLTVEQPTIANVSAQSLSPDATSVTLSVEQPTISNVSAQSLSPDTTAIGLTVEQPTIANVSAQGLSPNATSLSLTVQQPTIALEPDLSLQPDATGITLTVEQPTIALAPDLSLQPDVVDISLSVEQPTVGNETAQGLSPDVASISLTVNEPTVTLEGQALNPDSVSLSLSVNNPTVANETAQGLSPNATDIGLTVEQPTVANETEQGLSPDSVGLGLTVNNPTVELLGQELQPDTVGISLTVNNPGVANLSPQGISPDTAGLTLTVNNVTVANETQQGLSPNAVGISLTVNNPTIENEVPVVSAYYTTDLSIVDRYATKLTINDQYTTTVTINERYTITLSIRGASMPYQVGQSPQLVALFKDNGVATNPTGVSVTVLSPKTHTVSTPTATTTGTTGEYAFNLTLDEVGDWHIRWVASGAVVDSKVQTVHVEETVFD